MHFDCADIEMPGPDAGAWVPGCRDSGRGEERTAVEKRPAGINASLTLATRSNVSLRASVRRHVN